MKNGYIAAFAVVVSMAMLALSAAPAIAAGIEITKMNASGTATMGQNVCPATLYWYYYDDGTGAPLPPATITICGNEYTLPVVSYIAERNGEYVELDFGNFGKLTGTATNWRETKDYPSSYAEADLHLEGEIIFTGQNARTNPPRGNPGFGSWTLNLDGTLSKTNFSGGGDPPQ